MRWIVENENEKKKEKKKGTTNLLGMLAAVVENEKNLDLFAGSGQRTKRRRDEARCRSQLAEDGHRRATSSGDVSEDRRGRSARVEERCAGRQRQRTGKRAKRYHCEGFKLSRIDKCVYMRSRGGRRGGREPFYRWLLVDGFWGGTGTTRFGNMKSSCYVSKDDDAEYKEEGELSDQPRASTPRLYMFFRSSVSRF